MGIANAFLFNFSASYSGGGLKRLSEYAKWFNENGGAWFIIHPRCERLVEECPANRFFIPAQPRYQRLFADCRYLEAIGKEIGQPELYYSYGIPLYARFGAINWFHVSNVLPLVSQQVPLPLFDRLKLGHLGGRIRANLQNADVISAESNYSLALIDARHAAKLFLSVNGSDDELAYLHTQGPEKKENIAVVVGTYTYKAIADSYKVFEMLKQANDRLKLMIIGDEKAIPEEVRRDQDVIVRGVLERSDVAESLRKARYYISATRIENSYNAAAEGVFVADESYISDIGPHRELLAGLPFVEVSIPGMRRPVLHVRREKLSGANLKTWENVITDMIRKVRANACGLPRQR